MSTLVSRFQRAMNVFDALCELPEPERSRLLALHCGDDPSLCAAVRAMLDHDAAVARSLDHRREPPAVELLAVEGVLDDTLSVPASLTLPGLGERVGRYIVGELLGCGGMGAVYQAWDPELEREVALKLPRVGGIWLLDEARALARLAHPNVVQVYDVGRHEGEVYVAMELVRGPTLRQWLAERPRPVAEVLAVFRAAGRGLAAAHAGGLIHRDFKPDNVIVADDGRVLVVDFGLARATGETPPVGGTPAYMAPEQLRGEELGEGSDQFSFCIALHEALLGERPFPSARAHTLPYAAVGPVPHHVRAAVSRGLAIDPRRRHPSMTSLLASLSLSRPRCGTSRAAAVGGP